MAIANSESDIHCDWSYRLTSDLPFSAQSLNPADVIDLANTLVFNTARWAEDDSMETGLIGSGGYLYTKFNKHRLFPTACNRRVPERYGARTVAKRLIALTTKPKYLEGSLGAYQPLLMLNFCAVEEVRVSLVAQRAHGALLRAAWDRLRVHPDVHNYSFTDFGPRGCWRILVR